MRERGQGLNSNRRQKKGADDSRANSYRANFAVLGT